jgi:hypothetical protein
MLVLVSTRSGTLMRASALRFTEQDKGINRLLLQSNGAIKSGLISFVWAFQLTRAYKQAFASIYTLTNYQKILMNLRCTIFQQKMSFNYSARGDSTRDRFPSYYRLHHSCWQLVERECHGTSNLRTCWPCYS